MSGDSMPARAGPPSTTASLQTPYAIPGSSKDAIKVGTKAVVCQDAELRGDITIGAGCILHPRCTIFAYAGPIIIGDSCIIEENAIIVNRSTEPMIIGSFNLFEVGCRIESPRIGSYNTFEPRCRVTSSITLADYCTIGAGCTATGELGASEEDWLAIADSVPENDGGVTSQPVNESDPGSKRSTTLQIIAEDTLQGVPSPKEEKDPDESPHAVDARTGENARQSTLHKNIDKEQVDHLPSYTVIYGGENERRVWTGEGQIQQTALMHKHLAYLTETLPKFSRLKLFT